MRERHTARVAVVDLKPGDEVDFSGVLNVPSEWFEVLGVVYGTQSTVIIQARRGDGGEVQVGVPEGAVILARFWQERVSILTPGFWKGRRVRVAQTAGDYNIPLRGLKGTVRTDEHGEPNCHGAVCVDLDPSWSVDATVKDLLRRSESARIENGWEWPRKFTYGLVLEVYYWPGDQERAGEPADGSGQFVASVNVADLETIE